MIGPSDLRGRLAEVARRTHLDLAAAEVDLHLLVRVAFEHEAFEEEGRARYHLSRVLLETGRMEAGERQLQEVARCGEHADDDFLRLASLNGRVAMFAWMNRALEALDLAHEGKRLIDTMALGQPVSGEIEEMGLRLDGNIAFLLGQLGRYPEAIEATHAFLARVDAPETELLAAQSRANLGIILITMGHPRRALVELENAASVFQRREAAGWITRTFIYRAKAHAAVGEFEDCLEMIGELSLRLEIKHRQTAARTPLFRPFDESTARVVLAEAYYLIGAEDEAREVLEETLPYIVTSSLLNDKANALTLSGELAADSDPHEAQRRFRHASALLVASGNELAGARSVLRLHELVPDDDTALFDQAASVIDAAGTPLDRVRLCLLRLSTSQPPTTEALLREAEDLITRCSAPHLLWRIRCRRGEYEFERGNLEAAREALVEAMAVVRRLRASIPDERLRIHHGFDHRRVVEQMTGVLLELELTDELFELLEDSYAVTLRERIEGSVRPSTWPAVSGELGAIYTEMPRSDAATQAVLHERAKELEFLLPSGSLELAAAPAARNVGEGHSLGTSPSLVYGIFEEEIFGLVRSGSGQTRLVRELTTCGELEDLRLDLALQRGRSEAPALVAHREMLDAITNTILRRLFDLLVRRMVDSDHREFSDEWQAATDAQIVVVPPVGFADLPFAAMRSSDGHLAERMAICTAPSTSVAAWVGGRARMGRATLAVGVSSPGLEFTEVEARQIARLVGGDLLIGRDATVAKVRERAAAFDVLHIASHGVARPDEPWFNGLRLADGWLTISELSGWRLDGQIVVLSGCETGQQSGRGLEQLGLPRALLAAGAGGVIASLSEVDDERTLDFMVQLHRHLAVRGPAEALRRTQLDFAAQSIDLRQWSSIAYIGGPDRELAHMHRAPGPPGAQGVG